MKKPLVIWGASGHALVVADIIRLQGKYTIICFLDDINADRQNSKFHNIPLLGDPEALHSVVPSGSLNVIIAFGHCQARLKQAAWAVDNGFELITAVHPRAIISSDAMIGPGTVITAGAVVNSMARIGANAIINTNSSIDHECIIGDGVHISPGSTVAGNVSIGRGTWIGMGSIIKEGVTIGSDTVIGAGSLVLDDIPSNVIAWGRPAKVIKKVDLNVS